MPAAACLASSGGRKRNSKLNQCLCRISFFSDPRGRADRVRVKATSRIAPRLPVKTCPHCGALVTGYPDQTTVSARSSLLSISSSWRLNWPNWQHQWFPMVGLARSRRPHTMPIASPIHSATFGRRGQPQTERTLQPLRPRPARATRRCASPHGNSIRPSSPTTAHHRSENSTRSRPRR